MEDFDNFFSRTLSTLQPEPPKPVVKEPPEDSVLKRLRKHKFYKAVIRCSTGSPVRRRVTVCGFPPDLDDEPQTQVHVKPTKENLIVTLKSLRDEILTLDEKNARRCIEDRASFRKTFDKMGNCIQWLKHKPERTCVEEKYLRKGVLHELKDMFSGLKSLGDCKQAYNYLMKTAAPGDKFLSNETEGLHILDEYLMKNDEDLFELVSSLDPSETGTLDCSKLASALQKENVPLETFQLLQGVTALDCSDGDEIDYKNFCDRMQNFRMYKWNRIVTNNQGFCNNLVSELDNTNLNVAGPYQLGDVGSKRLRVKPMSARPVVNVPSSLKNLLQPPAPPKPKIQSKVYEPRPVLHCSRYHSSDRLMRHRAKRKFWPGTMDNIHHCYTALDGKHPDHRQHPLFEIIRPETPIQKTSTRLPPFTRYTIYDTEKVI